MVAALAYKDSDPSLLVNWALKLLEEKGHHIGESFLSGDRKLVITVDKKDLIVEENGGIVDLASRYPE